MGSKCSSFQIRGSHCYLNACKEDGEALGASFNNEWHVDDAHEQTHEVSAVSSSAGGGDVQCYYKTGFTR